jgi:hypothetical protein
LFIALNARLEIHARVTGPVDFQIGATCQVELPPEAITVWPEATERP